MDPPLRKLKSILKGIGSEVTVPRVKTVRILEPDERESSSLVSLHRCSELDTRTPQRSEDQKSGGQRSEDPALDQLYEKRSREKGYFRRRREEVEDEIQVLANWISLEAKLWSLSPLNTDAEFREYAPNFAVGAQEQRKILDDMEIGLRKEICTAGEGVFELSRDYLAEQPVDQRISIIMDDLEETYRTHFRRERREILRKRIDERKAKELRRKAEAKGKAKESAKKESAKKEAQGEEDLVKIDSAMGSGTFERMIWCDEVERDGVCRDELDGLVMKLRFQDEAGFDSTYDSGGGYAEDDEHCCEFNCG